MLVARAGLSPVMVGRVGELARLQQLAILDEGPRVALVRGEAGVGKTRLIKELLAGLAGQPTVFSAQAEQGAMGRPYELLLDAVAPAVSGWSRVPPALQRWEDALGVLLAPMAPQLGAADRSYVADELARAGTELVRYLVGTGPAVLIFEDLHWADAESLGLFQRLAVTPQLPALLVGSYRPEDLDRGHVTDLMAAIERQRQVDHFVLGRLRVEEVAALVGAVRGGAVAYATAAALHRRTGGNPFFLEELLVAAGDAPIDALADLPLPVTLTEAVLRHLEGLDDQQRRVVDAAAVLGQRIPFDLLASVSGLVEDVLVDVLHDLVGRGLIAEDAADVFTFRHALTREAIAARLLARERRRLHEKCLAALEEVGSDDWAALAYHAAGAGRWEEMVAAARKGARSYLHTGATYQALRLVELALDAVDADPELLELAARAAWSVGLPASALERAEQWRRLAEESGDLVEVCRAQRLLARLCWESGDAEGHRAAVEAARVASEGLHDGEERGWVANLLAESAMLGGRSEEAVRWADAALTPSGGTSPTPALRAAVLVNKGSALIMIAGREDEGERLLLEGLAAASSAEDYVSALRAVHNLAHPVFPLWEPDRSAALLDQMEELIGRSGRQDWTGTLRVLRATFLAHVLGDLTAARAELAPATPAAHKWWASLLGAELALEAGDAHTADALLLAAEAGRNRLSVDDADLPAKVLAFRVRLAARRGPVQIIDLLAEELAVEMTAEPWNNADAWHHALVAALHSGWPAARGRELLERVGLPEGGNSRVADPGWRDHVAGALAEAEGRLAEAVSSYEAAVADRGWRRSPPAAADAHLGAARCLLAQGRLAAAIDHARRAEALLARWPGWRQADAVALLRRLAPGAAADPSSTAVLTSRESEVAVLVAEGLSNGEVAARLYISTKTASVHVSNILRKLGMTSRAEVAAWVVRQGLDG